MLVFEYKLRVRLLKSFEYVKASEAVSYFLDSALGKEEDFRKLHERREYKYYTMDSFYPCEKDGIYKQGKIYAIRIRTVKQELAEYFSRMLIHHTSGEMEGLTGELRIIPKKQLERVYSLTPVIIKTEKGYWREHMSVPEFEDRIKINLIKKYNQFNHTKIEENFQLYNLIEFKNKVPVKVPYKNITLLGDKINLIASNDPMAQELLYFSLGTGFGENNGRGAGFMNYQYI